MTFNIEDINDEIHNIIEDNGIENPQAIVALAVDNTLRHVVKYLYETGQNGTADFLEMEIG